MGAWTARREARSPGMTRHDEERKRKKAWERGLVDAFLQDFDSDRVGWTCVEFDREKPDFIYEHLGHRAGIEITELITPDSGRARAGEKDLAEISRDVVA